MDMLLNELSLTVVQLHTFVIIFTVVLHILCATGIARDIGQLHKRHIPTQLLAGSTWVLASLLTGLLGVIVYWLMHHSSLAR